MLGFAGVAFALPIHQSTMNVQPFVDSEYYLGTTTPSLKAYKSVITDEICVAGVCSTSVGGAFPFTLTGYGVSTSTVVGFLQGLLTQGSSTIPYASSTQISVGNGAVGSPALTFTSDPDTGIYRNGTNGLGLSGGGAGATWDGSAFYPNTDSARNIGIAGTNRWQNIFANQSSTSLSSVLGPLYVGTTSTTTIRGNATSSFSGGISLSSGCFAGIDGTCLGGAVSTGLAGQFPFYKTDGTTLTPTSTLFFWQGDADITYATGTLLVQPTSAGSGTATTSGAFASIEAGYMRNADNELFAGNWRTTSGSVSVSTGARIYDYSFMCAGDFEHNSGRVSGADSSFTVGGGGIFIGEPCLQAASLYFDDDLSIGGGSVFATSSTTFLDGMYGQQVVIEAGDAQDSAGNNALGAGLTLGEGYFDGSQWFGGEATLAGGGGFSNTTVGGDVNLIGGSPSGSGKQGKVAVSFASASSTPWGLLSIDVNAITGPSFVIGSSTKTDFVVTNSGRVGIKTTSPSNLFHVSLGTNEIAQINDASSASAIWGTNIGLISQSSQGQVAGAGTSPLVFTTGGTRNSMTEGTERARLTVGGHFGIGSSTPWGILSVASSTYGYKAPLFAVATSSDSFGQIFSLGATTSEMLPARNDLYPYPSSLGARVGVGGFGADEMLLDNFNMSGRINTGSWAHFLCEGGMVVITVSADANDVCGGWAFAEDGTGNLVTTGSGIGNPAMNLNLATGLSNDGNGIFIGNQNINLPTTTPIIDAVVSMNTPQAVASGGFGATQSGATSTVYVGFTDVQPNATSFETAPSNGCYFTASSTQANWVALCKKSAGGAVETIVQTPYSSSTPFWLRFRIETGAASARFYVGTATTSLRLLTTISDTSYPSGAAADLTAAIYNARATAGVTANLYIKRAWLWYRVHMWGD